MKEVIIIAVKYIVLSVIAAAVVLGAFTLFLAMPDILEWLSGYIGTTTTWLLFIFAIGAVIAYCIAE